MLLGAVFTNEYAIEGAALCNPSIVVHPDQTGMAAGSVRFVLSVRGIGEGHRSSIGFRTGVIDSTGQPSVDDCAPVATVGDAVPGLLDAAVFRVELDRLDDAGEAAAYVLDPLGERFSWAELAGRLGHPALVQQVRDTLRTLAPAEIDCAGPDGRALGVQVRPYLRLDGVISGAVLAWRDGPDA